VYCIDRIVSASIVSAYIMCITADSAAANTGRITQEIKWNSRPVTHRARGLEGREEGYCNLIPASLWHTTKAQYWVLATSNRLPRPLHQQELITSLNCQSLERFCELTSVKTDWVRKLVCG